MSGERLNAIDIAIELNKVLNSGVAIQPNSLFHDKLNTAVGYRKYEVSVGDLNKVVENLRSCVRVLIDNNKSNEFDVELYTICDIIKQLTNG